MSKPVNSNAFGIDNVRAMVYDCLRMTLYHSPADLAQLIRLVFG